MASHYGEEDMSKSDLKPSSLGSGMAANAASKLQDHNKATRCASDGGTYDFAAHKCKSDNDND